MCIRDRGCTVPRAIAVLTVDEQQPASQNPRTVPGFPVQHHCASNDCALRGSKGARWSMAHCPSSLVRRAIGNRYRPIVDHVPPMEPSGLDLAVQCSYPWDAPSRGPGPGGAFKRPGTPSAPQASQTCPGIPRPPGPNRPPKATMRGRARGPLNAPPPKRVHWAAELGPPACLLQAHAVVGLRPSLALVLAAAGPPSHQSPMLPFPSPSHQF